MTTKILHFIFVPFALLLLVSCQDNEKFTTDSSSLLSFSTEEVCFDTVISRVGSSTKHFSVYNNGKRGLRAQRVYLESGGMNGFRVNVDGQYCGLLPDSSLNVELADVEILHADSIMCFAEVTPAFRDQDNPVELTDRLIFELESGVRQSVLLKATSQDAIFVESDSITENTVFKANRPYVLYHNLTITEGVEARFEAGTVMMFHAGCGLNVKGRIVAEGTLEHPVVFRGDRTDKMFPYLPYDRLDAQWDGIRIDSVSYGNELDYVDIHSGSCGIVCAASDTLERKLSLTNSVIHNVAGDALVLPNCYSFIGNSQISNALGNCLSVMGGQCAVVYSTIAQFYPWKAEKGLGLYVANHIDERYCPLTQCTIVNSIVTGYGDDEILFSYVSDVVDGRFDYVFLSSMLNTVLVDQQQPFFINCRFEDASLPAFKGTNFVQLDTYAYQYNFNLTPASTARGIADPGFNHYFPYNRLGKERSVENPDAGCY